MEPTHAGKDVTLVFIAVVLPLVVGACTCDTPSFVLGSSGDVLIQSQTQTTFLS